MIVFFCYGTYENDMTDEGRRRDMEMIDRDRASELDIPKKLWFGFLFILFSDG